VNLRATEYPEALDFWALSSVHPEWMPLLLPKGKKRTAFGKLKEIFRASCSQPARLGEILCDRALESVLLIYPKLSRNEGSASSGQGVSASRLRLEAAEQEHWDSFRTIAYRICHRTLYSPGSDKFHNP
jgi:hypothetical protein